MNWRPNIRVQKCAIAHLISLGLLYIGGHVFGQGSLTPPGIPAPTMKKLDEIEPRTNLQGMPAPFGVDTTNASYHFIINQPGSYYLSANVVVTKPNGILISVDGVTLDLNGFQISRSVASGLGIQISAGRHPITIRNGSIKGFSHGIDSVTGSIACAFRDLVVSGCTTYGILVGNGAVLESCRAHENSGTYAIAAGSGSVLTNCTASNNTTTDGIFAGNGSTLTNCTASNNTNTAGIEVGIGSSLSKCSVQGNTAQYGILAGSGSSLSNCSASSNTSATTLSAGISVGPGSTVSNCASRSNTSTAALTPTTGMGFDLGTGSTIQDSTASGNNGDGIRISSDCAAQHNRCDGNGSGAGGTGAGIHSTGNDNRIEGNNVTDSDRGIDVDAGGSLIIRNSASGNSTNYEIAADNRYGVIVDNTATGTAAASGNSAAATTTTTSPWANFSF